MTDQNAWQRRTLQGLTDRQKEILEYISSLDTIPTLKETAEHFGINFSAISKQLNAMRKKGYVLKSDGKSRNLKVVPLWHEHNACVIELASWMVAEKVIETAEEAISVFRSPRGHNRSWKDFCNSDTAALRRLEKKFNWRNN